MFDSHRFDSAVAKLINPDQLSVVIREHMSSIREHQVCTPLQIAYFRSLISYQGVSTTPLVVTIESGHASTRNITIVGMYFAYSCFLLTYNSA
jgi:hypothetical protein